MGTSGPLTREKHALDQSLPRNIQGDRVRRPVLPAETVRLSHAGGDGSGTPPFLRHGEKTLRDHDHRSRPDRGIRAVATVWLVVAAAGRMAANQAWSGRRADPLPSLPGMALQALLPGDGPARRNLVQMDQRSARAVPDRDRHPGDGQAVLTANRERRVK